MKRKITCLILAIFSILGVFSAYVSAHEISSALSARWAIKVPYAGGGSTCVINGGSLTSITNIFNTAMKEGMASWTSNGGGRARGNWDKEAAYDQYVFGRSWSSLQNPIGFHRLLLPLLYCVKKAAIAT